MSGIFGSIGRMVGSYLGGSFMGSLGSFVGSEFDRKISNKQKQLQEYYSTKNQVIAEILWQNNQENTPIAQIYGKAKLAGNVIWCSDITTIANYNQQHKAGKNIDKLYHQTEYINKCSFAIAICEGEIDELLNVWLNDDLIDLSNYSHEIYCGNQLQADPTIVSFEGADNSPAFKDLCYIVFKDFTLDDYNGVIPNFTFEVERKLVDKHNSLESKISDVVMIPACGEYVYDTEIQYKKAKYAKSLDGEIYSLTLNCHNKQKKANAIVSLDNLQQSCPNLKHVSVTAAWFTNSLDIRDSIIYPAIEYRDADYNYSEAWQVAGINREEAKLIGRNKLGQPNYGGTPNDASILRYLTELKNRKLEAIFYPLLMVDEINKPWRGRVSGNPDQVREFFQKDGGYNQFILHYAKLVKGKVKAFIIGSELKELTEITDGDNNYPAVKELQNLAAQVKAILGDDVKISYAADWSEYHHDKSGFYHLDNLWADRNIDFVAIDAYFPLTNSMTSQISYEDIYNGWQQGEGYSYYYKDSEARKADNKTNLNIEYAWKNLNFWWSNNHYHPNGEKTAWQPKMKKVWFTELGFPSIDKATNQPNIFYDPDSIEGGVPYYSNAQVDFYIQRLALEASLDFWQKNEMIEHKFIWCWDARPHPAWPENEFWADGKLWLQGHWLNGKLGFSSLAAILECLAIRAGYKKYEIIFQNIDDIVKGLVIKEQIDVFSFLQKLAEFYNFSITELNGKILFKRNNSKFASVIDSKQILAKDGFLLKKYSNKNSFNLLQSNYFEITDYKLSSVNASIEKDSKLVESFNLPIVIAKSELESRLQRILINIAVSSEQVKLKLMPKAVSYKVGDVIALELNNSQKLLKINQLKWQNNICYLTASSITKNDFEILKKATINAQQNIATKNELAIWQHGQNLYYFTRLKSNIYQVFNRQKTKLAINPASFAMADIIDANFSDTDEAIIARDEYITVQINDSLKKILADNLYAIYKNELIKIGLVSCSDDLAIFKNIKRNLQNGKLHSATNKLLIFNKIPASKSHQAGAYYGADFVVNKVRVNQSVKQFKLINIIYRQSERNLFVSFAVKGDISSAELRDVNYELFWLKNNYKINTKDKNMIIDKGQLNQDFIYQQSNILQITARNSLGEILDQQKIDIN